MKRPQALKPFRVIAVQPTKKGDRLVERRCGVCLHRITIVVSAESFAELLHEDGKCPLAHCPSNQSYLKVSAT